MKASWWRSHESDTWPHYERVGKPDYWPQSTHVVDSEVGLVLCATGVGGGSQQACFRRELDPLLQAAVAEWKRDLSPARTAASELDRLFATIQDGFDKLTTPLWHRDLQASAVAFLAHSGSYAVANTGRERIYVRKTSGLQWLTVDDHHPDISIAANLRNLSLHHLGNFMPARWHVRTAEVQRDDELLLATGLGPPELEGPLEDRFATELPDAEHIGSWLVERFSAREPREAGYANWYVHSRVSLAVVRL